MADSKEWVFVVGVVVCMPGSVVVELEEFIGKYGASRDDNQDSAGLRRAASGVFSAATLAAASGVGEEDASVAEDSAEEEVEGEASGEEVLLAAKV